MGEVEDAASAYWGGAAGSAIVDGPAVAVYPGRECPVLVSCAVVLGS